jgi:hypothetical protein
MVGYEAFHVFQDKQAPDKGANEMLLSQGRRPGPAMSWAQGFVGYADLAPQREELIEKMIKNMSRFP